MAESEQSSVWDVVIKQTKEAQEKGLGFEHGALYACSCSGFPPGLFQIDVVQPAAYRLYMELLKRHAFSLRSQINGPNYRKVMISIDTILNLSKIFGLQTSEAGTIVVGFIFSTVVAIA
ncbi:hypothetical protein L3X38_002583 [Prunus dulcis]|uniref:Uncharacterized protein n=1 Tax=Prunus dulcis TaxID=3755 RepID=A0AAD4WU93_PRUDU|nr:hypothetical protein L3X38_002583 [Prunus dulcis]